MLPFKMHIVVIVRALQTAQLILDQNKAGKDLEVVRDPDLREFNLVAMKGI